MSLRRDALFPRNEKKRKKGKKKQENGHCTKSLIEKKRTARGNGRTHQRKNQEREKQWCFRSLTGKKRGGKEPQRGKTAGKAITVLSSCGGRGRKGRRKSLCNVAQARGRRTNVSKGKRRPTSYSSFTRVISKGEKEKKEKRRTARRRFPPKGGRGRKVGRFWEKGKLLSSHTSMAKKGRKKNNRFLRSILVHGTERREK